MLTYRQQCRNIPQRNTVLQPSYAGWVIVRLRVGGIWLILIVIQLSPLLLQNANWDWLPNQAMNVCFGNGGDQDGGFVSFRAMLLALFQKCLVVDAPFNPADFSAPFVLNWPVFSLRIDHRLCGEGSNAYQDNIHAYICISMCIYMYIYVYTHIV